MLKVTLFLLLLGAAAGEKVVSESAAAPVAYTAAPTAAGPAMELVEDTEPAVEEPVAEEPAAEEPAVEAPVVEEPAVEEPAVEEPIAEEPVVEKAAAGEPAAEEEAVEEAAAAEEPAAEEPSYEQAQSHESTSYQQPAYSSHRPFYGHHQASYGHHQPAYKPSPPACSLNTTKPWCLEDSEYPIHRIAKAITIHHHTFVSMYQDVLADTANSVDRLQTLEEETYLCSSQTSYVQPLRAQDTDGKWRIIVNGVRLHDHTFTQTARLEECQAAGEPCPLVPGCYPSSCLQKSAVHRMLVFDEYDHYSPFAIETFKLPSACACALESYEITH